MQLLSDKHRQSKGALVWRARDNETAICNDRLFWLLVVTLIACESDHMSPALLHETSFSLVEILSFLLPILFFFFVELILWLCFIYTKAEDYRGPLSKRNLSAPIK